MSLQIIMLKEKNIQTDYLSNITYHMIPFFNILKVTPYKDGEQLQQQEVKEESNEEAEYGYKKIQE